jgi:hypothetical protein
LLVVDVQKKLAREEKQNELAKKRIKRTELRWEVTMLWKNGAQLPIPFLPIPPDKQISVVRYICQKYPEHFPNLGMAQVYVSRTVKGFKNRPDNKAPFRDKRGETRQRKKRNNAIIIEHTDRILCRQKGRPKTVVNALADEGIVVHESTIRLIMKDLNIHCVKAWYTDILTEAQKYKRLLFAKSLLRLSPDELLHVLMGWMFTDEKW